MKSIRKRVLSLLLTAAMLLSLLPAMSGGAAAEGTEIDLSTVSAGGTGFTYSETTAGSKVITITSSGTYTLTQSGGTATPVSANVIVEPTDEAKAVTLLLNNVNIAAGDFTQTSVYKSGVTTGTAAISVQGNTTCTLTLVDTTENTLTGHSQSSSGNSLQNTAAIYVENTYTATRKALATLIIQGQGTLSATGVACASAIGGNDNRLTGNITINSGVIKATSGNWAAAIGDGDTLNAVTEVKNWYCSGTNQNCQQARITINGGTITAEATEATPAIGTADQLSTAESGTAGAEWDGMLITVNGGNLLTISSNTNNKVTTGIGAGSNTKLNSASIVINQTNDQTYLLALSRVSSYAITNDPSDNTYPSVSSQSTANILNIKLATAAVASKIDFWKLVNGTYEKQGAVFPNSILSTLKGNDYSTIYGIAVVLPDGSYKLGTDGSDKVPSGDPIDVKGGGMVTGEKDKDGNLTLHYPPKVSAPASVETYAQTADVSFSVTATNQDKNVSSPTYTYQWQCSTDGGKTWSNVSGATAASYTIAKNDVTTGLTGNEYRCVVVLTNNNLSATSAPATLIVRTPVTVSVTRQDATYDGKTHSGCSSATVTDHTDLDSTLVYTYTGKGTTSYGPSTTAPTDAGSYHLVVSVPSDNTSYAGSAETDFTISPKEVTVSGITANNKVYDGSTAATLDCSKASFDGAVTGDTLTVSTTGTFADADVGSGKTVTLGSLTLGGADAGNYTLAASGQQTTTTASITPAARTIPAPTANISAKNAVTLDADTPSAGADDGTVEYGCSTTNDSAGVTSWQSSTAFTGLNSNTNYYFFARVTGGKNYSDAVSTGTPISLTGKMPVTVGGVTIPGKIYDGSAVVPDTSALTVTGGPFDAGTLVYTYYENTGTAAGPVWTKLDVAPKNAGSYKLVVSVPEGNADYSGSAEIPFAIAKAAVTVTAANKTVQKDGTMPALTYSVAGLVSGETLLTEPTLSCTATDTGAVGTYPITASGADAGGNYQVTFVPGTLTVTADAPRTFTVTFDPNGGKLTGSASETVAQNTGLTKPADPSYTGFTFVGWYLDKSGTTAWNFDTGTVTADMTLYAKWTQGTHSVSGDVTDSDRKAVSGALVTIVQGTKVFKKTATGSDGKYTFEGVAPGVYNVVAVKDNVTKTILVTIRDADLTEQNINMPKGDVNSILNVTGSGTPDVVVGGLETQADTVKSTTSGATDVVIRMTVEEKAQNVVKQEDVSALQTEAAKTTTAANLEYIDIAVKKTVTVTQSGVQTSQTTSQINTTDNILEIVIPYSTANKTNITVYRYHTEDGEYASTFTALNALPAAGTRADQTFYVDRTNDLIFVYAKKFSTYAISYKTPDTPSSGAADTTVTYPITVTDTTGGTAAVSVKKPTAGTSVTITVTPDASHRTNGVTVTDASGKAVPVKNNGDGTYTFTQPASRVTVTATFTGSTADPTETGVSKWLETNDHRLYLNGYTDGSFGPDRNMTRAEAAQMFYNLLLDRNVAAAEPFSDVNSGAWYAKAVNTLAALDVLRGVGDGQFAPDRAITRAEFTAIAMRFATLSEGGTNSFSDVSESDWFYAQVVGSEKYGWINGYSDGTFRPNATITRAEVTAIVNRMLDRSADTAYVDANVGKLIIFPDATGTCWAYYDIVEATNAHDYSRTNGTESWKS